MVTLEDWAGFELNDRSGEITEPLTPVRNGRRAYARHFRDLINPNKLFFRHSNDLVNLTHSQL